MIISSIMVPETVSIPTVRSENYFTLGEKKY